MIIITGPMVHSSFLVNIARRRRTRSRSLSFRSSDLKRSQLDRNLMKYEIGVVFSTTVMFEFQ